MWIQNPAETVKIEYKLEGHANEDNKWSVWHPETDIF